MSRLVAFVALYVLALGVGYINFVYTWGLQLRSVGSLVGCFFASLAIFAAIEAVKKDK